MSLNLQKLEKVRELAGGIVQARCPACAEGGADKTGNHLRIQADGRFGCCVHPKDTEHRKRIFALVGVRDRQPICVKVAAPQVAKIIQSDVLGRLGRVFATPSQPAAPNITPLGTLGTPTYSNAYAKNNSSDVGGLYMEEFCSGVPSVPELPPSPDFKPPVPSVPTAVLPDEREAIEAAARGKAAEWESREQKLRETEWAMHEAAIAAAKKGLAAYMEKDKVYANLADIARMLEIASKLGRLATGLGDGDGRKADDLPAMRVEVTVALEKIYGEPLPGEIVDVEAVPVLPEKTP